MELQIVVDSSALESTAGEDASEEIQQIEVQFGGSRQPTPNGLSSEPSPAPQAAAPPKPRKFIKLPFLDDIRNRSRRTNSTAEKPKLSYIQELAALRTTQRSPFIRPNTPVTTVFKETLDISQSPMVEDDANLGGDVLKVGTLTKTSQSRSKTKKGAPGHPRGRKFRLTHDSLDYLQTFSHVKVKRSYPLTAVEGVEYDNETNPLQFQLIFSTYIMTLVAESEEDARDWVEKINGAWSMWKISPGGAEDAQSDPSDDLELASEDSPAPPPPAGGGEELPTPDSTSKDISAIPRDRQSNLPKRFQSQRSRSYSAGPQFLRREDTEATNIGTYDARKKRITRRAFRIARLKPHLHRSDHNLVQDPERGHDPAQDRLHKEFSMIKYPSKILRLPTERIFTIDKDNLQILWRTVTKSGFRQKSSLSLRRIVEIRKGQQTTQFDKFPYEQVEDQSFSLLFESENNKYAKLSSLDLICDRKDSFNDWMEGLQTLVSSTQWLNLFPPRYENSDPTILWLKQIWTCKSDGYELKQHDAIKLAKKFIPTLSHEDASTVVKVAHGHQFKHTFNYGAALRWDGFVLMFYLLCDRTGLQLYDIFLEYAKKHPTLGLTMEEFRQFLIVECHWLPAETKPSVLLSLMKNHDEEHHQSIKKFCALNKPAEYQTSLKLLSFAGFLSFLRSRDNSVINLEHETVYQDMTQPLSHYFINSSHNTYLEGDQLRGTSSTDAYVRTLLQGCRCVEIDCWDDVLNVNGLAEKEPVIYHGHTLTTKIAFRDVIHAINNYGFTSSLYPVIISIENHCSSTQQSRMAKIFRAIFAERLPLENLVELEGRERLPSPEELQGKVILKGSVKKKSSAAGRTKKKKIRTASQAALSINTTSDPESSLPPSSPRSPRSPQSPRHQRVSSDPESSLPPTSITVGGVSDPEASLPPTHFHGSRYGRGDDQTDSPFDFRINRSRQSLRVIRDRIQQQEQGQDDQELSFTETAEDLSVLIVYSRSRSIKPWDWKKQKATTVSEMFSFGEPTAVVLCKNCPRDMLCCTERQLVRTYPKGTRFDSSNYDPMLMWNCGIQLVALNFQYPGLEMHLNQGFFRLNGGCGYVLKPLIMRREDPGGTGPGDNGRSEDSIRPGGKAPYNPDMMVPHPAVTPVQLEIELLSGQRLSSWNKKCNYLTVDIQTFGIKHDTTKMKQATHANSFWPRWQKGDHVLQHQILMPELCLVYFRVENEGHKIYGQNCFPLISLIPGIKFVPLRTNGGEIIPESGLFVRIKKVEEGDGLGNPLSTIPEDDCDVTMSLFPARKRENGTTSPGGPRRVTSPPVLQSFRSPSTGSSNTAKLESTVSVTGDENEVVLTVEVHPEDGMCPLPNDSRPSQWHVPPNSGIITVKDTL